VRRSGSCAVWVHAAAVAVAGAARNRRQTPCQKDSAARSTLPKEAQGRGTVISTMFGYHYSSTKVRLLTVRIRAALGNLYGLSYCVV
jgi:hypothetical protein